MADNFLQVVIGAKNQSDPAFKAAIANTRKLSDEMKGVGGSFREVGRLARQFGGSDLAAAVGTIEMSVLGLQQMSAELGKSKAAMLALGTAATGGGYGLGKMLRPFMDAFGFNDPDKAEAVAETWGRVGDILNQRLALKDPALAQLKSTVKMLDELVAKSREMSLVGKWKDLLGFEGNDEIIGQLELLKRDTIDKYNQQETARLDAQEQKLKDIKFRYQTEVLGYEHEFASQRIEVRKWEADQLRLLEEYKKTNHEQYLQTVEGLEKAAAVRIALINQAEAEKQVQLELEVSARRREIMETTVKAGSEMFANLAQAARAFGKKGFEAWKAFSIAQAIVDTYKAANAAYAALAGIPIVGPALGAAAAGAAIAAGLANVAIIAQTKPAGAFHGGTDYVPQENSYLLQRGERVIQPRANEDLTRFLKEGRNVSVTVNLSGREILRYIGEASASGQLTINSRAVV